LSHDSWDNVPSLNKQETSKMVKDKYWISTGYRVRGGDPETQGDYWNVMCGEEFVMRCRAKSRSKVEMQKLLDHVNAMFDLIHALEKRLEEKVK
jgi:hypothetical protein